METPLEKLSTSSLRSLLIEEIKLFIASLDDAATEELEKQKLSLRRMYELIQQKEKAEKVPLEWGNNSPKTSPEIFVTPPMNESTSGAVAD